MSEYKGPTDASTRTPPAQGVVPDDVDYGHRHFINLLSAAFLLLRAVAMAWAVKALDQQESTRKCFASGRKDCVTIVAPPREMRQAVR
jgi:hypothetical protein